MLCSSERCPCNQLQWKAALSSLNRARMTMASPGDMAVVHYLGGAGHLSLTFHPTAFAGQIDVSTQGPICPLQLCRSR